MVPAVGIQAFVFFLMIRRPPRSTLFPTRRSSDLLVARDSDVESAALAADRRHALRLRQDLGARAVQLDEEHRARVLRISGTDRKSTRLNSSHSHISYAVFCLKK